MDMPNLPGDLTTPPLTPPPTSEPMNGNRNNVSDSVHANSANFKTTTTTAAKHSNSGVGVAKDTFRKQLVEAASEELLKSSSPIHTPQRMEATPPALVVIETAQDGKMLPGREGHAPSHEHGKGVEDSREAMPPSLYSGAGDKGQGARDSLQSMQVTSAGSEVSNASSSEDEMEELELVLVEEDGEPLHSKDSGATGKASHSPSTDLQASMDSPRDSSVGVSSSHRGPPNQQSTKSTNTSSLGAPHRGRRPSPAPLLVNGRGKEPARNGHTPGNEHGKMLSPEHRTPSQDGGGGGGGGEGRNGRESSRIASAKQAAKVKQFFTTIQHHGNKLGCEVAEQVQELIHALMVS